MDGSVRIRVLESEARSSAHQALSRVNLNEYFYGGFELHCMSVYRLPRGVSFVCTVVAAVAGIGEGDGEDNGDKGLLLDVVTSI